MYEVKYINCKVCGSDVSKFLGIRGNMEYAGVDKLAFGQEHVVTNVVRCKRCGFVYANPLIISDIDGYADPCKYQASSSSSEDKLFNFTLNFIERFCKTGKILDIGCGKGEFLAAARKRGWQVYGVEPSANFVDFAAKEHGLNIKNFTLQEAGYPDNFFDVATLNMVLEHVDEPKALIACIRRVLNDKGLLFIEVPNIDSLMLKLATIYFRLKGRDWSPLLSPTHYPFHAYGYGPSAIKCLLRMNGFDIEKVSAISSNLRGFRSDTGGTKLEKLLRAIAVKTAGLVGRGDVLVVMARKTPN